MAEDIKLDCLEEYYEMSDKELAELFLVPKTGKKITIDTICDKGVAIKSIENEDGSIKYPYYASLMSVDLAFFHSRIFQKYIAISRNPKKYDINMESIIAVFDKLLEENWTEFDAEVRKADLEARQKGLKSRNFSFILNNVLIEKVLSLVASIDLNNVHGLEV